MIPVRRSEHGAPAVSAAVTHDLVDTLDVGVLLLDRDAAIVKVNRWLRERLRGPAVPSGRRLDELWAGRVDPRLVYAVRECLEFGHSMRLSHAFHPTPLPLHAPGERGEERMRHAVDVIAALGPDGRRQCVLQVRDMSEIARRERLLKEQARQLRGELQRLTEAQQELGRQSLRFREMARLAPVGLIETDEQGMLSWCNERGAQMLGVDLAAQLGRHWLSMLPPDDIVRLSPRWSAACSARVRFAEEICLVRAGVSTWLRLEAGPMADGDRLQGGYIGTLTDITELREHARRNEWRANHDALTGLANRAHFTERLQAAVAEAARHDERVAILYVDLDRFKQINDAHGHAVGDLALKTAAQRMRRCLRSDDVVARLGGDEFAVLIPSAPPEDTLERILAKITKAIAMPINAGSCCLRIGCSVGIALFPDHARSPEELLAQADARMYHHKRRQGGPGGVLRLVERSAPS